MPARRLFQFILLIALMLAPICTMGGAAMAMPSAPVAGEHHGAMADASHCQGMGEQPDDEQERGDADCRMACAGVLAQAHVVSEAVALASVPKTRAIVAAAPGLNHAAEPPPPRLS